MTAWPPLTERKLLDRLTLGDDEFAVFAAKLARLIGTRVFDDAALERALGYPWARPQRSYVLDNGIVTSFDLLALEQRRDQLRAIETGFAETAEPRFPLLAFGSNGAPEVLAEKFAQLAPDQRMLVVAAGELRDFDVGVSAHNAHYGAMPATIFSSPGTAVRASVLWVTSLQLSALAWTEVNYHFGRLDGIQFIADFDAVPLTSVFAFASRIGVHRVDGHAVAMKAVAAAGRTAPALTQEQLLDRVAAQALGNGASARELVRSVIEDFAATSALLAPVLRASAQPFESDRWTRY